MWKKVLISLLAMVGTFSVVYAIDQNVNANVTSSYSVGGEVTGRINMAPSGISGDNIGFQKGDKTLMGTKVSGSVDTIDSYVYHNEPISWQLIAYETYTDYGCNTDSNPCLGKQSISNWRSLSTKALDKTTMGLTKDDFTIGGVGTWKYSELSSRTDPYVIDAVNNNIKKNNSDKQLIAFRNLTAFHSNWNNVVSRPDAIGDLYRSAVLGLYYSANATVEIKNMLLDNLHIPSTFDIVGSDDVSGWDIQGLEANFISFYDAYFGDGSYWPGDSPDTYGGYTITANGTLGATNPFTGLTYIRPEVYLNLKDVVFAVSPGTGIGLDISVVTESTFNYSSALYVQGNKPMKLRILNSNMTAVLNSIQNSYATSITKTAKGDTVLLQAGATSGQDSYGNQYMVSAIIFDENNNFVYYKPLEIAKGYGSYELDTTEMNVGKYKIAIVNEAYNINDTSPADSSLISDTIPLEVVEPHKITYTKTPQPGASLGKEYEFNKNVSAGQVIGNLTINPVGKMPLTYTLESNGDNTYQNFMVDGLDSSHTSNVTSLNIIIKNDAPNLVYGSLEAGTYKFCITSIDANGYPNQQVEGKTKVCSSFNVDKTKPTLSFGDSKQVDIKIGQAADKSGTISFTNTDTSFSPKLTFTSDKGDTSLLTVQLDPNDSTKYIVTPASTYSGTTLPATYTLTLSGEETENFIAPDSVTKTYYLYKELSGLEWNAVSSSINVNDVATSGETVGTLLAKDGYPDYTYELVSLSDKDYDSSTGKDNALFILDQTKASYGTKINVKTTGRLSAKQYYLQFKVTDKKGATQLQTGTFTVTANAQSSLSFYDKQGGTTISSMSVTYGDTSKKLYAEGGSTSKAILYGFAPSDQQPSDLQGNAQDYATINSSTGVITPKKVGTIKVMATRPGDDTYSAISVTMDLNITDGEQKLVFDSTIPKKKAFKENEEINIPATLTRDDQTSGTIKYISETPTICIVEDETVAKVKMLTIGKCSVKAYNEDDNYKNVEDHVMIQLYEGIQAAFTPKANVKQGDQSTKADYPTGLASITLSKGDGTYTFVSMSVKKDGATQTGIFELTGSDSNWKIIPKQDIGYGTYDVTIKFKDGENAETEVSGTITIGLQENKDFILTYDGSKATSILKDYQSIKNNGIQLATQGKLGSGTVTYAPADTNTMDPDENIDAVEINPVTGLISVNRVTTSNDHYEFYAYIAEDTSSGYAKQETQKVTVTITESKQSISFTDSKGNTITEISETYAQTPNDTFQLYTKKLGNGKVSYKLKDTSSTTVVQVSDSGLVTILKATSTTAPETVIIVATVEAKDGYEAKSVEIPVTIKQASQKIKWKNENNSFVAFDKDTGFSTTKEEAVLDRDDKTLGSIKYESENLDICTIDPQGNIKGLKEGACSIKAKNTDTNYTKAEISKTVTFYTGLSAKFTQAKKQLQADSSKANALAGTIDVTGGTADSEFVYSIHDGEGDLFAFSDSTYGVLSLARDLSIADLQGVNYNSTKGGYPIKVKVDITDQDTKVVIELECEVVVKGAAQTTVGFNDGTGKKTTKIERVYEEDGVFSLGLLDNLGGTPTYTLKTNSPEDVIEVTGNMVTILNANDKVNDSRTVIVQAVIAAKNGYDAKTIECEVEITKAAQTTFKFSSNKITMLPNSNTVPILEGGIPKDENKGEGIVTLSSDALNIVSVDASDPTKIQSHDEGTTKLTAIITGNRNYKDGKAETTVIVTTAPAYAFKISVPAATYGDTQEIKGNVIVGSIP